MAVGDTTNPRWNAHAPGDQRRERRGRRPRPCVQFDLAGTWWTRPPDGNPLAPGALQDFRCPSAKA